LGLAWVEFPPTAAYKITLAGTKWFCDSVPVTVEQGSGENVQAALRLGPMDGRAHPIESDTQELSIVMTDGQQHRYERTDEVRRSPNGELLVFFDWAGRYYGPK
jgi:hypothetical protein